MERLGQSLDFDGATMSENGGQGTLRVEVPTWLHQVSIFNHRLEPVRQFIPVNESATDPGVFTIQVNLDPGIYQVRVGLAGRVKQEFAAVFSHAPAAITRDRWNDLTLDTAAPLIGADHARDLLIEQAVRWSRTPTWQPSGAVEADSRLVLFIGTPERDPSRTFADGLSLLDAHGRMLTDFSVGVERDDRGGWLACTADLPAGYYLLRMSRRGVRVHMQPLVLSAGWESQVFLTSEPYPVLRRAALIMAPVGSGFSPDDEASQAAAALLAVATRPEADALIMDERMQGLLARRQDAPWLAIIAGYAHLSAQTRRRQSGPSAAAPSVPLRSASVDLTLRQLDDHPDVRALSLQDDRPAARPFWYPPTLRSGLRQMQRHAIRHTARTIPQNSLTDHVLDNLLPKSRWTVWARLDYLPTLPPDDRIPLRGTGPSLLAISGKRPATPSPPLLNFAATVAEVAPEARFIRLTVPAASASDDASADPAADDPEDIAVDALNDVPILQRAGELLRVAPDNQPASISLDLAGLVQNFLAQVQPEEISAATGEPSTRYESSLGRLRQSSSDRTPGIAMRSVLPRSTAIDPVAEHAILSIAATKAAHISSDQFGVADEPPSRADPAEHALKAGDADAALEAVVARATRTFTLEDCVAILRTEADRLAIRRDDVQRASSAELGDRTMVISARLNDTANRLLRRADFVAITDANGRLVYGNDALVTLLSSPQDERVVPTDSDARASEAFRANSLQWEADLANAPPGPSQLSAPLPNPISQDWNVQCTAFHESNTNEVAAVLRVLRAPNTSRPDQETLTPIESLVSELTLYAPLLAYGSPALLADYVEKLEALSTSLEDIVGSD